MDLSTLLRRGLIYHVMRANGVPYTTHTDSAEKSAGLKVRTGVLGHMHVLEWLSILTSVHLSGPEFDPKVWSQALQSSY